MPPYFGYNEEVTEGGDEKRDGGENQLPRVMLCQLDDTAEPDVRCLDVVALFEIGESPRRLPVVEERGAVAPGRRVDAQLPHHRLRARPPLLLGSSS